MYYIVEIFRERIKYDVILNKISNTVHKYVLYINGYCMYIPVHISASFGCIERKHFVLLRNY